MMIFLIRHKGRHIHDTAIFLKHHYNFNDRDTALLSSKKRYAIQSASIIRKTLKLKEIHKEKKLSFNSAFENGSSDHQIMMEIFLYGARNENIRNVIVISHHKEIKCTLDAFTDMLIPKKSKHNDIIINNGSVYRIQSSGLSSAQGIDKVFDPLEIIYH